MMLSLLFAALPVNSPTVNCGDLFQHRLVAVRYRYLQAQAISVIVISGDTAFTVKQPRNVRVVHRSSLARLRRQDSEVASLRQNLTCISRREAPHKVDYSSQATSDQL